MLRLIWPEDVDLRRLRLMGLVMAVGTYAIGVSFFVLEVPALLNEGEGVFVFHLLFRLGGGVLLAFLVYLPYYVASAAGQKTGRRSLFADLGLVVFVVHIALTVFAVFLPQGSTSAVGVVFFPVYLAIPLLAIWAGVHVAGRKGR